MNTEPMPFVCLHGDPRCEEDSCPWGIARTLCNAPADHPSRMITLPPLTKDEHAYLLRLLGAPSSQGTRTLGVGLTAQGAISLRKKLDSVS